MQFASGTYPHTRVRTQIRTRSHKLYDHAASCSWRYRWSLAEAHEIRRCLSAAAAARTRFLARPQGRHPRSRPDDSLPPSPLLPLP